MEKGIGHRVLFIRPQFFYFGQSIEEELRRKGHKVFAYSDRPSDSNISKALIRLNRGLVKGKTTRYIKSIIDTHKADNIDKIIIILGQSFFPKHIKLLKAGFPKAEIVYYLWDALANAKYAPTLALECDRSYYFESDDHDGFTRLNNFFDPDFVNIKPAKPEYDYCYIGTAYPNKLKEAARLVDALAPIKPNIYFYFYIPSKLMKLFFSFTHPGYGKLAKRFGLKERKITKQEVLTLYAKSKGLLDFPRANQTGLTMRTLEALGGEKKLITTNLSVGGYDFYNPQNIYLFNGEKPDFSSSFFAKPDYLKQKAEIVEKYSLAHFVSTLLGD